MHIPATAILDSEDGDFLRLDESGHAAYANNDIESAIAYFQRALESKPGHGSTMVNLANCLRRVGRYDEAIKLLRGAKISGKMRPFVEANLAVVLHDLGRHQDALAYYRRACAAMPENDIMAWNQAQTLLTLGHYTEGWVGYARGVSGGMRGRIRYALPLYRGKHWPQGKLLIYQEQGIGDQILFASCFNDVARESGDSIVECSSRLKSLFKRSFPALRFVDEGEILDETVNTREFQLPMGSVMSYFRNGRSDFPASNRYLVPDLDLVSQWKRSVKVDPRPVVGLSWRGGTIKDDIERRQVDLNTLISLLNQLPIQIMILQHDISPDEDQILKTMATMGISYTLGRDTGNDLEQLAAMIAACDVVVSVGNTVLNLAGAMNVKSIGLVPFNTSWRWGTEDTTPWYPSIKLIRQDIPGSWFNAMASLIDELSITLQFNRTPAVAV